MSSPSLPYNLRFNKAVDRSIFMEFLMKMHAHVPLNKYTYIGFGAMHMDDFRVIHSMFGIEKLISIESNTEVFIRQSFNKPVRSIELKNMEAGDFIETYDFPEETIIWLDYVSPKQLATQIREFQTVLEKCTMFDLVKISINANPNALGELTKEEEREVTLNKRLARLKTRISDFLNEDVTSKDMTLAGLPKVLTSALINAANMIYEGSGKKFYPISSFAYADGNHQMITFSGIILEKNSPFLNKIEIENWKYYYGKDKKTFKINLPDLSLKERLTIDSLLPSENSVEIIEKLGYENSVDFEKILLDYIEYYRHFPNFSKIII